jgi:hypothetical protein
MESIFKKSLFANLITLFALSGLLGITEVRAQCQAPKIKEQHIFSSADDYRAADQLGVKCMKWLLETPLKACTADRNALDAFVLVWLSGHPDFTIRLEPRLMPSLKRYPELLFPAIYGMALAHIEQPNQSLTSAQYHAEAAQAVLDVIDGERCFKGDDDLKQLRKLRRKNKLEGYFETLQGMP